VVAKHFSAVTTAANTKVPFDHAAVQAESPARMNGVMATIRHSASNPRISVRGCLQKVVVACAVAVSKITSLPR
jgi:hypothetical protein